ncbi:hypothetical protein MTO96_036663 [Rhipicephalus appendiculatus]
MDALCPVTFVTATALVLSTVAIAFVLLIRWRRKTFDFFRGTGIQGPTPNLFSGNFYQFWHERTLEVMDEWFKKYGDIFGMFNGDAPFVLVKDVELLRRVFVSDFGQFIDRGTVSRALNETRGLRNAISLARGDRWKPLRRMYYSGIHGKQASSGT